MRKKCKFFDRLRVSGVQMPNIILGWGLCVKSAFFPLLLPSALSPLDCQNLTTREYSAQYKYALYSYPHILGFSPAFMIALPFHMLFHSFFMVNIRYQPSLSAASITTLLFYYLKSLTSPNLTARCNRLSIHVFAKDCLHVCKEVATIMTHHVYASFGW